VLVINGRLRWQRQPYVDPAGSNSNSGTQAAPWRTVGKAAASLSAGKVACVNSGTYGETGAIAANSGTGTAPIVLKRTRAHPRVRSSG
jgi:hypothetical protein